MQTELSDSQRPTTSRSTVCLPLVRRNGQVVGHTLVDANDATLLGQWTWRLSSDGYAVRSETKNGAKRTIYLHRAVMQAPRGAIVDHVNGDRLDCRRANLRLVTPSQNNANSVDRPRHSGYRGVYPHRQAQKWVSQISINGRLRHLGLFDDPADAARAYDRAARSLHGQFARTNGFA